jgi:predicted phosphohydrolase
MLQVMSDLHLEFDFKVPVINPETSVLILAGDIAPVLHTTNKRNTFNMFLSNLFSEHPNIKVIFVAGNHEYYGTTISHGNDFLNSMSAVFENFYFLNNSSVEIEGVNYIGSTLWTNFKAFGVIPALAELAIQDCINDFRIIKVGKKYLTPNHVKMMFSEAVDAIERLKKPDMANVVVTHFGPSEKSQHSRFSGDMVSAYFMSNCERLFEPSISLWVHGHTHASMDYKLGDTRVICNPKGYYAENPNFQYDFMVKL